MAFESVFFYLLTFLNSILLFSLPSSRRTGGFFLRHQKETKKCFFHRISPSCEAFFPQERLLWADSAGKRLTKIEVYIETTATAVNGGGNVACAVFSSTGCACFAKEMQKWYRLPVQNPLISYRSPVQNRKIFNSHRKRAQPDRRTSRIQSLHRIITGVLACGAGLLPIPADPTLARRICPRRAFPRQECPEAGRNSVEIERFLVTFCRNWQKVTRLKRNLRKV